MNDVVKQLSKIGIVPVIKIDNAADAKPLAKALIDGGLPCAEVTFRTACAKEAIAIIAKEFPEMIVGAGTVLTKAQVDDAIEAGAKFIVSPGFNPEIVKYCQSKGCPIVPGINNPSGIEAALELGLETAADEYKNILEAGLATETFVASAIQEALDQFINAEGVSF